jgi:hypothetical protein
VRAKARIGFFVFVFFLCLYLLTSAGDFYSSDGEVMYQAAGALADRGSLALAPNPGLPQIVQAVNGEWVSKYDPGLPMLGVLFYQAGSWIAARTGADRATWTHLAVALMPGFCMALAVTALYAIAARLADTRRALMVALIAGIATIIWPYSRVLFPEALLAALLTLAVWAALHPSTGWAFLGGTCLGMAIATRAVNGLYTLPLLLLLLFKDRRLGRILAWGVGVLPWIGLVLAHNALRFGSPLLFGYTGENFSTPFYEGIFGLLLSGGKGIFWYAPPLIISAALWPRLRRSAPDLAWTLLVMAALAVAAYGTWIIWHGGWNWGPRYLVPLVSLWMIPLVKLPSARRWSVALIAALLIGLVIQWAAVRANSNDYYAAMGVDTSLEAMRRVLFDPAAAPIPAQLQLYWRGQTVPLIMADLGARSLPPPWSWLVPGLLVGGLTLAAWSLGRALCVGSGTS